MSHKRNKSVYVIVLLAVSILYLNFCAINDLKPGNLYATTRHGSSSPSDRGDGINPRYVIFCGTRPEIIKVAPVIMAMKTSGMNVHVVFTGQHPDIATPFRKFWDIPFDTILRGVFQSDQTISSLVGSLISIIEKTIPKNSNDIWIVQGDTSSGLAAGLVAFFRSTPLIHLEAGLRTFDHSSPFPEEVNRHTLSLVASLHVAPSELSEARLLAEGVEPDRVVVYGNTGIDAARLAEKNIVSPNNVKIQQGNNRMVFVTMHRRENADRFESFYNAIGGLEVSDVDFVVPVHPNPAATKAAEAACAKFSHIQCVPPMGYGETQWMLKKSMLVLTDSGGLQEEATWYGRPVLVLRDATERTEAINAGSSVLIGNDPVKLKSLLADLCIPNSKILKDMSIKSYPFGGEADEATIL
ncbi:hypothetical protein TrVE_jg1078 [Triparma verrucosa]|uniref:UDP-N-acetylglucosamine 2-epimerase domain-containing protein n=1 Tax=Triparma verrucosa TaxID=1606542 RepID=A0A9W6ZGH6_9STRA|nr:hypothetical protein TrVE_jg1078 [Triparma verrucosa]